MKVLPQVEVELEKIVGGGQALGTLSDGRKIFVWGGLPGELVAVQITKKKTSYAEGVVTNVLNASAYRIEPADPESCLSTSPWQIVDFKKEQTYKAELITEAFAMHKVRLPGDTSIYSDGKQYNYRNKVEFSWWWDTDRAMLDLAFYRRGSKGKIPVTSTSLARTEINLLAQNVRDVLRTKNVEARSLKTLLIRCDQSGDCVWQLYVKDRLPHIISEAEAAALPAKGGEVIYSDPRSPASRITERLTQFGDISLTDTVISKPYQYTAESFFQINIPVYEQALRDISSNITERGHMLDFYSGVGSIGLSLAANDIVLVEVDEHAYRELSNNIRLQNRQDTARAVQTPAEKALENITNKALVIVDPPRSGLHAAVIDKLLEARPPKIVYLSCNPVTQARDVSLLQDTYTISYHRGYNFFPRTPHIEHLVILTLK